MKNLKKVLALVLVVALMMGFATVAGAADFTDDSDIVNQEAVDVMSEIGVINGYPDGSFRPEGNVTRAQMAKMIAYIVSGGEDVGDLYAGATAFSDCLTHWARGYIAYANTTGIIAGVGNGLFNPDGDVTGVQAAKMMLCALGYNQDTEGYTGTGWNVNVLADARTLGLLDGLSSTNMNAALSRGDAAQLMFNALECTMVEYDRGTITVDGGDATVIIGGSEAGPVLNESFDYQVGRGTNATTGDRYMQMCEMYFEDLSLDTGDSDDFMRPAHTWVYGRDDIGTYVNSSDLVVTYTSDVSASDIRSDLRSYDYEYGTNNGTHSTTYINSVPASDYVADENDLADLTEDGRVIEVYANSSREITDIVIVDTTYATVTAVNETRETFTVTYGGGTEVIDDESAFYGLYGDVEEDDILAVCYAADDDTILDLYIPETVTGEITRINANHDQATVGGESVSATYNALFDPATLGNEATVYLSSAGYAIYVDATADSATDYIYVTNIWQGNSGDNYGNEIWYAQGVLTDGTIETLEIANRPGHPSGIVDSNNFGTLEYGQAGEAYSWSRNPSAGVYEYQAGDEDTNLYVLITRTASVSGSVGVAAVTGSSSSGVSSSAARIADAYVSEDVTFVYVDGSGSSLRVTTGGRAAINDNVDYSAIIEEVDGANQVTVVYVAAASAASEDVIYVSDGDTQHTFLDADDISRTGREVTYYAYGSDEAETMIVDSRTDVNPGFYTQSGTNGEAVQLLGYGSNTVVNVRLNSMSSNGNYATMVGVVDSNRDLIDFNFTGALVVDVADSNYASLTAIERALRNGETFFLSFTYDSDYAVETVYIQSVKSADVTLDSMTLKVDSGTPTEPTYYTDSKTALANAIAVTNGQTLSLNVAASDDDATVTVEYRTNFSSGSWATDTSFTAATGTNAFRVTVTAADGVTSAQYFVYFNVTAGT